MKMSAPLSLINRLISPKSLANAVIRHDPVQIGNANWVSWMPTFQTMACTPFCAMVAATREIAES